MKSKIETIIIPPALAAAVIADLCDETEMALLAGINRALKKAGYSAIRDMSVDEAPLEYGVLHVRYAEGQAWIEINPVTGECVAH